MSPGENVGVDTPDLLPRVGDQLRAAREAQGLSVAEVASALKFSPRQVELVEANAWTDLPGYTFVRGFVRNYARFLRLDSAALLHQLELAPMPKLPALDLPRSTAARLPHSGQAQRKEFAAMIGGLLLVMLAVIAYFLVPEDLWQLTTSAMERQTPAPEGAAPPAAPAPPAPAASPAPPVSDPAAGSPPPSASPASPAGATARLRLQFGSPSWIEIRDQTGAVLMSQTNAAGTTQEVTGSAPFTLVIGDARLVSVFFNGQPVDLTPFFNEQSRVARVRIE